MLRMTRGWPGAGKTHHALEWVAQDSENRRRANRDELRKMIFGRHTDIDELDVKAAQLAIVETFLRQRKDVIVDDANLKPKHVEKWSQIARRHGHAFEVVDITTSLAHCLEQNAERGRAGGQFISVERIEHLARRYPMPWKTPDLPQLIETDFRPYDGSKEWHLPATVLVDLDGTFAQRGDRSPYDFTKVGDDVLNETIDEALGALTITPEPCWEQVVFMSGRPESCREATQTWLTDKGWGHAPLLMRKTGDDRADYVVKYEIFDREIRNRYNVRLVLDDRDSTVGMWRMIGLDCWQVARGDF